MIWLKDLVGRLNGGWVLTPIQNPAMQINSQQHLGVFLDAQLDFKKVRQIHSLRSTKL